MSVSSEHQGTGSSYSNSRTSSVENVSSTVESGELSVFTFVIPLRSTPCLFSPNHHHSLTSGFNRESDIFSPSSPFLCSYTNSSDSGCCENGTPSPPVTIDPYNIDHSDSLHCKYYHQKYPVQKFIHHHHDSRCPCHHQQQHPLHHHLNSHVLNDSNYIRLLRRTGDGLLLRSMEKGVLFPVIHWSTKSTENLTHSNAQFSPNMAFNQGIYKEIKRVIPPDIWLQRDPGDPNVTLSSSSLSDSVNSLSFSLSRKPTWLIIGYKSLEKTLDSSLEATWKEWTGIRHVYLNLRSDFEIRKISFLHRVHPLDNLDLFMYIVLMEIGNVEDRNRIWLLDFVQRMRVERMKGFLTVYSQVEQELSSIDDEYNKYANVSEGSILQPPPLPPKLSRIQPLQTTPFLSLSGETTSSTTMSSTSMLDYHTSEINGNIKFMEKLLEEIHQQPIGDYF